MTVNLLGMLLLDMDASLQLPTCEADFRRMCCNRQRVFMHPC